MMTTIKEEDAMTNPAKHTLLFFCMVFLLVMVCLPGCSRKSGNAGKSELSGDTLTVDKGSTHAEFSLETPIEDTFMLFGIQAKGADYQDGYLAAIPLTTVRKLKERYADIDSCKGDGASVARGHVQNLHPVGSSSEVMQALRAAYEQYLAAQRSGGDRICVHLRGQKLRYIQGTYMGMELGVPKSIGGEMQLVYPESMQVVSCL